MMKNADFALYKSKKEGKNQFNYFTPELDLKAKRELYIKTNLLKAAQNKKLYMNYQPIINYGTNEAFAIESLARWRSRLGFITPDEFIPAAEKINAICDIGFALIETAIKEYANSKLNSHLSINVSTKQLALDKDFFQKLSNTVAQHQLSPKKIIIEITESCIIRDINLIRGKLEDLAEKGFAIAIDDFGTGYSSLSLLANLPFKYLKLDKSFIFNSSTTNGFKVLQCIYNVAHSLDTEVIAEGVETLEQAKLLHEMGVNLMQGYYFAKPQDLDQLVSTIK